MERKILRKEVSKDVLNKIKEKYDALEMTDEAAKKVYSLEITSKTLKKVTQALGVITTIDLVIIDPVFGIDEAILIGLTSILGIAYKYVKGSVDSVIETGSMKDIDKEDLESIAYTCANMINSSKNKTKVKTK